MNMRCKHGTYIGTCAACAGERTPEQQARHQLIEDGKQMEREAILRFLRHYDLNRHMLPDQVIEEIRDGKHYDHYEGSDGT